MAGWRLYRSVLFLPYILAVPIIAVVMRKIFQFNGPMNDLLRFISLDFLALDWIGSSDVALWTVMILIIWHESALGIILLLARLLSLDETLVESAKFDGANWWQRPVYVIVPQMKVVIELYILNTLIRTSLPGIASAASVLLFLVSLLLIVPLCLVRRRANEEAAG